MKFILGKKLDMTQIWKDDEVIAVTRVQAGPCVITQVKDRKKDGYMAVQVGYGEKKEKNIKKPQRGHLNKLRVKNEECRVNFRYLKEFRIEEGVNLSIGDIIDASVFEPGDQIKVTGVSKGKGFQGVVKRYGFHGQDKSHGTKDQLRMPGSIGATGPARVFKGVRMPGRMGGNRVTVKNLEIVGVDREDNILLIKGAVPGARNGLVMISGDGELKIVKSEELRVENEEIKKGAKDDKIEETAEAENNKKVGEKKVEEEKKDEPIKN
jgi:large subunit ribosomal protein L3